MFFLGFLFQLLASEVGWPTSGRASPIVEFDLNKVTHFYLIDTLIQGDLNAFWDVLQHLFLPALVLGLTISGVLVRLVRVNLLQTMRGDYVEAARARGVSERRVVVNHAFRNAMVPVVTVAGLQFAILLGGADPHRGDVQLARNRLRARSLPEPARLHRRAGDRHRLRNRGRHRLAADRPDQRVHRPAGQVPMRQRRLSRWLEPIRESTGVSRWIFWIGVAIVAFFVILAVFAPLLAPYGFDQVSADGIRFPKQGRPTAAHPFGTTVGSYDVLSRVIWGARTAIEVVVLAVVFSLVGRRPARALLRLRRRPPDRVLVLIMDALFAFPYMLLAIVIAFLLSASSARASSRRRSRSRSSTCPSTSGWCETT